MFYAICQVLKDAPKECLDQELILTENPPEISSSLMFYCYLAIISLLITAVVCVFVQRWKYSRIMDLEVKKKIDRYYQLKEGESFSSSRSNNSN